jgi:transposase
MAISKELRLKVEAELAMGKSSKELSAKYEVPYVTIQGWRKKLDNEVKDVNVVTKVDPAILHTVAQRVKEEAPAEVAKKVDKLVAGVTSLQTLEPKFHAVVLNLLEAAEEMSKRENLSIRDWKTLGDGIGSLYASVFNKSGVNVNVMNQTNVSGEKLSLFKGSLRA